MEGFKMEAIKPEINFAKESSGVWDRIMAQLIDKVALEAVASMNKVNVDEEKMKAVRTVVEEEVRALLENNAELVNTNTVSWAENIANATDAALAEEMKARRLFEILDETSGGNFVETVAKKIK
jgi:hypothetical protein